MGNKSPTFALPQFFFFLVILFACEVAAAIWGFMNRDTVGAAPFLRSEIPTSPLRNISADSPPSTDLQGADQLLRLRVHQGCGRVGNAQQRRRHQGAGRFPPNGTLAAEGGSDRRARVGRVRRVSAHPALFLPSSSSSTAAGKETTRRSSHKSLARCVLRRKKRTL